MKAKQVKAVTPHTYAGCEDCMKIGAGWLHLRLCETCGHVGCCDSSPNRHATAHFHETSHPVVKSFEPGEEWSYDYRTEQTVETPPQFRDLHHDNSEKRGAKGWFYNKEKIVVAH